MSAKSRFSLRGRYASLKFLLLGCGIVFALFWSAASREGVRAQEVLALLLFVLCAFPIYRYLQGRDHGVPWVESLALIYALYYALPALLPFRTEPVFRGIADESRIYAQTLALIGMLVYLLTFYAWPRKIWEKFAPQIKIEWTESKAKRLALPLAVVGFLATASLQVLDIPIRFREPLNYFAQLSLVGIGMLMVLTFQNRLTLLQKGALLVLFSSQIVLGMASGAVAPVARLAEILFLIYTFYKRDLPLGWSLLIFPILIVLLATKMEFRGLAAGSEQITGNPFKRAFAFSTVAYNFVRQANPDQLYLAAEVAAQRIDMLSVFSDVVNKTPYRVPYWDGRTYASVFWKFVPRVIYPDKPMEQLGQEFGHRYGLVDPQDFVTAMNLPQLVEMYANFGAAGVVIGMFLLGLICQFLDYSLNHETAGEWGIILSAVLFSQLITLETNFSITYGNLVYSLILLLVLQNLLLKRKPARLKEAASGPALREWTA